MIQSILEGWHTVTPRIVVQDVAMQVDFLKHAFGASGDFKTDSPSNYEDWRPLIMVSGVSPRAAMSAFLLPRFWDHRFASLTSGTL